MRPCNKYIRGAGAKPHVKKLYGNFVPICSEHSPGRAYTQRKQAGQPGMAKEKGRGLAAAPNHQDVLHVREALTRPAGKAGALRPDLLSYHTVLMVYGNEHGGDIEGAPLAFQLVEVLAEALQLVGHLVDDEAGIGL